MSEQPKVGTTPEEINSLIDEFIHEHGRVPSLQEVLAVFARRAVVGGGKPPPASTHVITTEYGAYTAKGGEGGSGSRATLSQAWREGWAAAREGREVEDDPYA